MNEMNRREFVLATVGGLGLVGTPQLITAFRQTSDRLAPPPQGMHVRHDVYCLNPTGREIRSYMKAVQVMRSRPATDPTSWAARRRSMGRRHPSRG